MINYNESVMKILNRVAENLKERGFRIKIMTFNSEDIEDWQLYFGHGKALVGVDAMDVLKGIREMSLTDYVNELSREYKEPNEVPNNLTELLKNKDWVKEHLTVRVLPQEERCRPGRISRDTKFEEIRSFLFLKIRETADTIIGAYLTPEMLQEIGIPQDDAWENVYRNVEGACVIKRVKDVLAEEYPGLTMSEPELYVITNAAANYGAASILNDETPRDFGEKIDCRKFIAIPSSVHEFLLIRYSDCADDEEVIRNTIRDVNENNVAPRDRLGEFPYLITIDPDAVHVSALKG